MDEIHEVTGRTKRCDDKKETVEKAGEDSR